MLKSASFLSCHNTTKSRKSQVWYGVRTNQLEKIMETNQTTVKYGLTLTEKDVQMLRYLMQAMNNIVVRMTA